MVATMFTRCACGQEAISSRAERDVSTRRRRGIHGAYDHEHINVEQLRGPFEKKRNTAISYARADPKCNGASTSNAFAFNLVAGEWSCTTWQHGGGEATTSFTEEDLNGSPDVASLEQVLIMKISILNNREKTTWMNLGKASRAPVSSALAVSKSRYSPFGAVAVFKYWTSPSQTDAREESQEASRIQEFVCCGFPSPEGRDGRRCGYSGNCVDFVVVGSLAGHSPSCMLGVTAQCPSVRRWAPPGRLGIVFARLSSLFRLPSPFTSFS